MNEKTKFTLIKYSFRIFKSRFFSVKTFVMLMLLYIFARVYIVPVRSFCKSVNYPISQYLFPFLTSGVLFVLLYTLLIIYYFSDIPFMSKSEMWYMQRLGRKKWITAQIIYIFMSAFVITILLYIFSLIPLIGVTQFEFGWGKIIYSLAIEPPENLEIIINIPYTTIKQFSALQGLTVSLINMFLFSAFLEIIMFTVALYSTRIVSLVVGATIAILPIIGENLFMVRSIQLFSPASWIRLTSLSNIIGIASSGRLYRLQPSLIWVYSAFFLLFIASLILIYKKLHNRDYS